MLPDDAAEKLQLEERGVELLKRCDEDPKILKAIEMLNQGFSAKDVAELYNLPWVPPEEPEEEEPREGEILVWECKTVRCRQKGRVSTSSAQPNCPSCGREMDFLMSVIDDSEIGHMRRTFMPNPGISDPLARTDKTKAPDFALGDDD